MFKDKVNEFLVKIKQNLPELAFLFYSIRLIVIGASLGEALAAMALAGLFGYHKFLNRQSIQEYDQVKKDMNELKNQVLSIKMQLNGNIGALRKAPVNGQETKEQRYF